MVYGHMLSALMTVLRPIVGFTLFSTVPVLFELFMAPIISLVFLLSLCFIITSFSPTRALDTHPLIHFCLGGGIKTSEKLKRILTIIGESLKEYFKQSIEKETKNIHC
ncbi:MAG: hypothetical protein ACTSPP_11555 [Candidatus Heimdallarchaeaceae archaeon]